MHDSTQNVYDKRRKFVEAILKRTPHLRYSIHLLEEPFFYSHTTGGRKMRGQKPSEKTPMQHLGNVW